MSFNSVLIDGTFRNPFVVASVLITALMLFLAAWALIRFALVPQWPTAGRVLLLAVICVGLLLLSRPAFNGFMNSVANLGAHGTVGLCLMPTDMPLRDFAPGAIAVLAAVSYFLRRSSTVAAA